MLVLLALRHSIHLLQFDEEVCICFVTIKASGIKLSDLAGADHMNVSCI